MAEVKSKEPGMTPGSGYMDRCVLYTAPGIHITPFLQQQFSHLVAIAVQEMGSGITLCCCNQELTSGLQRAEVSPQPYPEYHNTRRIHAYHSPTQLR